MITIDYIVGAGAGDKKPKKWLFNTWTDPKEEETNWEKQERKLYSSVCE